jgi:membrane protein DedA with SNARE-associated domain/membrane-associated phospholipid phosphatase
MTLIGDLIARLEAAPPLFLTHWGYPLLFLLVFGEGIPFLGFVIPGQSVALLAGFLAKLRVLRLWMVLLVTFVAALLGDIVGYELGRRWGYAFLIRHGGRFHFGEKEYRQVKRLLEAHPGKAIIIGRFHSLTRVFAPFIAGATEMNRGLFNVLNVVAAFLWSVCFVFIGYVFGRGFEAVAKYVGTSALVAFVASALLIIGYRRIQAFVLRHQHRFLRYPVGLITLASASLILLASVIDNVQDVGSLARLDTVVAAAVPGAWSGGLTLAAILVTNLFNWQVITPIALALFVLLLKLRRRRTAWIFAATMLVAFAAEQVMKLLIHRPRPLGGLVVEAGGSLPSGHATMAAAFCCLLVWAYKDDIVRAPRRRLFATGAFLLALLVGLSRVYLNVHWVSDVLAGWSLGLLAFSLVLLVFYVFRT